jgi:hypothetical protein
VLQGLLGDPLVERLARGVKGAQVEADEEGVVVEYLLQAAHTMNQRLSLSLRALYVIGQRGARGAGGDYWAGCSDSAEAAAEFRTATVTAFVPVFVRRRTLKKLQMLIEEKGNR